MVSCQGSWHEACSDRYFKRTQEDAIDVYLSFVMAAAETERLRFGSLVSPVTFREPVNVGPMAQQLDALSGGRFVMGLGDAANRGRARARMERHPSGERALRQPFLIRCNQAAPGGLKRRPT